MIYTQHRSEKKHRIPVLAGVLIVITLACVGMFFVYHETVTFHNTSQRVSPYTSVTKAEQAITHGTNWFVHNLDQTQSFQRLMLDYIQRKFDLDQRLSAASTPIPTPTSEPDKSEYSTLLRIVEPNQLATSLPTAPDALNQRIMAAANCDHIPVPAGFDNQLAADMQAGGYQLTHVILMLDFMTDNGCVLPANSLALRPSGYQAMAALATDAKQLPDLRYEATALLLYNNQNRLVQADTIRWIVARQQRDGGWTGYATVKEPSSDHPTLLALWALLEYYHPNTPNQPIIRRPR